MRPRSRRGKGLEIVELSSAQAVSSISARSAPVQQKALRFRRYTPLARRQLAALVDVLADFVNQNIRRDVVFQQKLALLGPAPPRRRHRNHVTAFAPARQLLAGGLAVLVQFVMPLRLIERPVDNRVVSKCHAPPSATAGFKPCLYRNLAAATATYFRPIMPAAYIGPMASSHPVRERRQGPSASSGAANRCLLPDSSLTNGHPAACGPLRFRNLAGE